MKKISIIISIITVAILQSNCTPKATKATANTEKTETAKEIVENFSEEQLTNGKIIWQSNCNKCHKLYEPKSRNTDKWDRVLRRMIPKAKLSPEDGALVRAYIIANAGQE